MRQKYLVLVLLLVGVLVVSGCTTPNEPTNPEEPEEPVDETTKGIGGTTVVPDIEEQIVKYPWRPRVPTSINMVFRKGFLGNSWKFGSSSSSSSGSWELVDLTEEDIQSLYDAKGVEDISAVASKKLVVRGWHAEGKVTDLESIIEVYTNPETNAPELYRIFLTGDYIRDFKNPL